MAPDLGFVARTGWGLGIPIVSWGYGGSGQLIVVVACLEGSVHVHPRIAGDVFAEVDADGDVRAAVDLDGLLRLPEIQISGSTIQHVLLTGSIVDALEIELGDELPVDPVVVRGAARSSVAVRASVTAHTRSSATARSAVSFTGSARGHQRFSGSLVRSC